MCGRYTLKSKGVDLQRELHLEHEPVLEPRFNIAPTQAAPIVLDAAPRQLVTARWGFTPRWAKDVNEGARHINARAESLAERRMFQDALLHARCLVPCDGFYEWRHHGKQSTPMRPGRKPRCAKSKPAAAGGWPFRPMWATPRRWMPCSHASKPTGARSTSW